MPAEKKTETVLAPDEVLIYVYLYNANGLVFRSWQNMLTPKVFYEYSVNRPIYSQKSEIESLLKSKKTLAQHAYLTIAVKASDIIKPSDHPENPIIKVREGSLHFDKLVTFAHNGQDYTLNINGELIKKE